jgi:hypothetical protein
LAALLSEDAISNWVGDGSATGTGRRREATPRHALARIGYLWRLRRSHAGNFRQSNICAMNIQRSHETVNEMAIHICRHDVPVLLRAQRKMKRRNS